MKQLNQYKRNKRAQDEMVGFALILIMVAVIFIVIISVWIRKPQEKTVNYEANSFIQSLLQYTTSCEEDYGNLTVQDLLAKCKEGNPCYYNDQMNQQSDPCKILNNTIREIVKASWQTGVNSSIKGYSFNINISEDGTNEEQFINIKEGVVTNNYRGGEQDLPPERGSWEYAVILFNVYS
jgi:hypothetical protein